MPNDLWEGDIDVDDESDLVKQLRAVIKAGKTRNTELETELTTLRPAVRQNAMSSVLTGLKVNPKISKLIPESVDANEESVKTWLDEYGEIFNVQVSASSDGAGDNTSTDQTGQQTGTQVSQEQQQQWARIQSQNVGGSNVAPDVESQQLAQLTAAYQAANGSTDAFFAMLKGEQAIPNS